MDIAQCRMARSGLRWTLDDLAARSGRSRRTVARFELGGRVNAETVDALRKALESAGAEFVQGDNAIGVVLQSVDEQESAATVKIRKRKSA